ncbi:hypothetical protein AAFF_G00265320 [Aldrovandia affinis]|uniref:Ig-like domain-containing protein n=1 Tax=Aldrovandia affinis TaxID=143900 RepID=A0AAD7RBP1_9TELE|nr:hypothetical protein AAFF_G00265320 [Aldrovandia affinis]
MEPSCLNNMRTAVILIYTCWSAGLGVSSAQSESKALKCIVGERVSFSSVVKEVGFIFKKGQGQIAKVISKIYHITNDSYSGRLQWDSSTGIFQIAWLNMEDSGEYRVQNNNSSIESIYQLTVYNPVSRPRVSSRNKMNPTCSVLCSVQNGREVTLSWQREGETLNHTSSPDLSTLLSLSLEIEYTSAPYSCIAKNPARTKNQTVKPEEYCFAESNITYYCVAKSPGSEERTVFHPSALCMEEGNRTRDVVGYIMFVLRLVEFVLVTLAVGLLLHMYRVGRVLTQHSTERRRRRYQETDTAL